jgi:hypothetical protein
LCFLRHQSSLSRHDTTRRIFFSPDKVKFYQTARR